MPITGNGFGETAVSTDGRPPTAIKKYLNFSFSKKEKKGGASFQDLAFKMRIYGRMTMCLPCMLCTMQNKEGGKGKQRKT